MTNRGQPQNNYNKRFLQCFLHRKCALQHTKCFPKSNEVKYEIWIIRLKNSKKEKKSLVVTTKPFKEFPTEKNAYKMSPKIKCGGSMLK